MIKKIALVAALVGASALIVPVALADDIPATPLQHGAPTDLPGEKLIPGVSEAMTIVNGITQPILQPILAPGGAAAAPAAPPMAKPMKMRRRHMMVRHHGMMMHHHGKMMHHHGKMMHHHMMKKKTMMKKAM